MAIELSISIDQVASREFSTTDAGTIAAVRRHLGQGARHLVPAHDLAALLRSVGRGLWAPRLEQEEEPHMVLVEFS
jgi:hypothetical protein